MKKITFTLVLFFTAGLWGLNAQNCNCGFDCPNTNPNPPWPTCTNFAPLTPSMCCHPSNSSICYNSSTSPGAGSVYCVCIYVGGPGTNCVQGFLPIELRSFTSDIIGKHIEVSWNTELEEDISHFVVRRSFDGRIWEDIGELEAIGNSTINQQYRFVDETAMAEVTGNTVFYQLEIVEFSGKLAYSSTIAQSLQNEHDFNIYYVKDDGNSFEIDWMTKHEGEAEVFVYSSNGQVISSQKADAFEGHNKTIVKANSGTGIYIISIRQAGKVVSYKIFR